MRTPLTVTSVGSELWPWRRPLDGGTVPGSEKPATTMNAVLTRYVHSPATCEARRSAWRGRARGERGRTG
jgi:hypothetical protein